MRIAIFRWTGTITTIGVGIAFLFSTQRAAVWTSADSRHELSLMAGAVAWGWRPADWRIETDRFAAQAGWSVAEYGGAPKLAWWPRRSDNRYWHGIAIPLWMPFLLIATPTIWLWLRHLRCRPRRVWAIRAWPPRWASICMASVVLLVALFVLSLAANSLPHSYSYATEAERQAAVARVERLQRIEVLAEWAISFLLAWRFYLLLRRRPVVPGHCKSCGYNLTGSASGVCPECGTTIPTEDR